MVLMYSCKFQMWNLQKGERQMYKNLEMAIIERGIKKIVIAKKIGVCPKSLGNKIKGHSPFKVDEALIIRNTFFPEVPLDTLFEKSA